MALFQRILCAFLTLTIVSVCGMPKFEPKKSIQPTPTEPSDGPRAVYAGGKQGNYTLGFVPLIAVISNLIPRIISRYTSSSTTTQTTMARSAGTTIMDNYPKELSAIKPCTDSKLGRWPYPENRCLFYQCELSLPKVTDCIQRVSFDPSSETQIKMYTVAKENRKMAISECVTLAVYSCEEGYIFDPNKTTCVQNPTEMSSCSTPQ